MVKLSQCIDYTYIWLCSETSKWSQKHQSNVWNLLTVNNKDTITTIVTLFFIVHYLYCQIWTNFVHCAAVSFVDFKQVKSGLGDVLELKLPSTSHSDRLEELLMVVFNFKYLCLVQIKENREQEARIIGSVLLCDPQNGSIVFSSYSWEAMILHFFYSLGTGRKLNVQKTFRRRLGRLLNVLCTFNLCPLSRV